MGWSSCVGGGLSRKEASPRSVRATPSSAPWSARWSSRSRQHLPQSPAKAEGNPHAIADPQHHGQGAGAAHPRSAANHLLGHRSDMTWSHPAHPGTLEERLSEKELCPEDLLAGQEAAFARDIARLQARRTEFVAVVCPCCARADARPAFSKFGFEFARCFDCGTIYMTPRPSPPLMAA